MIERKAAEKILQLAQSFKAVAIVGPRQSGKTTLARHCFPQKPYASLENLSTREFALSDPIGFLQQYREGAVLDEIQRAPILLSYLQQILDESSDRGKFILTGSNNFLLLEQISQSLAGRAAYLDLLPFSIQELTQVNGALDDLNTLIISGGYPPIQAEGITPVDWFTAYVRTYVERDVRQIRNIENLFTFEKMLSLCAGRVGQTLNLSNFSIELGVDQKTVQAWMGVLQASYVIHLLPPYFKNFNKRIVKTPKLYFCDTGLACYLLRISKPDELVQHPFRGALFENLIISDFLKNRLNQGQRSNLYFWRDSTGNEIDLLIDEGTKLIPIEIKSGQTITPSYFNALRFWRKITGQSGGTVIYGGDEGQIRSDGMEVKSWRKLA
ncbi:MAG: ATP-binding protein [Lewinellaceae bacterium]|nr:ATP-binding protein [Lewinellaceae bacterium]